MPERQKEEKMKNRSVIIGCGAIAPLHVKALLQSEFAELAALCDVEKSHAEKLAEENGLSVPVYTDYREMIEKEKPGAVHICTPHFLHAEMAIYALERGIHVFLEKPACMNFTELAALAEAERQSSAHLCVCFQNRFLPANLEAKRLIDEGEIGKVLGMRGFVTWNRRGAYYAESPWRGRKETEGGSVLMNQAIHTLDLMHYFGGTPESVEGKLSNHHMKGINNTEDTAEIYMKFPNGATGLFYATTAFCASSPIFLEVVGEKKTLRIEGNRLWIDGVLFEGAEEEVSHGGKAVWGNGHKILIEEFYRTLGEKSPVPLAEGARVLRTVFSLYEENRDIRL